MSEKQFELWQKKIIPQACSPFFQVPSPDLSPVRHRHAYFFDSESNEIISLQKEQEFFQEQFNEDLNSQQLYFFQEKENLKQNQSPPFEFAYDEFLEGEQIEKEKNEFQNIFNELLQVGEAVQKKKEKKFGNKSFCRYILVYAFRAILKPEFNEIVSGICEKHEVDLCDFRNYYQKQFFIITGYQLLKQELIIAKSDNAEIISRKKAFQSYLIWYLDNLGTITFHLFVIATKDILLSKKKDLKAYLKYKNLVMSYYVRFPAQWNGNEPEWNEEYKKH